MFGTIISGIVDGIVSALCGWISGIMEKRGLIQQGQAQQAAKDTATAEATEQKMGQAAVQSPSDKEGILARLKAGEG